jgi:hypothetical protein
MFDYVFLPSLELLIFKGADGGAYVLQQKCVFFRQFLCVGAGILIVVGMLVELLSLAPGLQFVAFVFRRNCGRCDVSDRACCPGTFCCSEKTYLFVVYV